MKIRATPAPKPRASQTKRAASASPSRNGKTAQKQKKATGKKCACKTSPAVIFACILLCILCCLCGYTFYFAKKNNLPVMDAAKSLLNCTVEFVKSKLPKQAPKTDI